MCHARSKHRLAPYRSFSLALLLVGAGGVLTAELTVAAQRERPLPRFANVENLVAQQFTRLSEDEDSDYPYKPGDLILREQVAPVFNRIKRLGWDVADRQQILARIHQPSDLLAQQLLGSEKGVRFMRTISKYPLGYDRIDRLNRLPLGKRTVHDLIHKVGGAEMIRYMTTAKGGLALGQMLSEDSGGKDFNKPTGRIYTQEQLIEALKDSYKAEKERRKKRR